MWDAQREKLKGIIKMFSKQKYELKQYFKKRRECKQELKLKKLSIYQIHAMAADIIRYTHSIEKGLSISNPRPEFGTKKITDLLNLIDRYLRYSNVNLEPVFMADNALEAYFQWSQSIGCREEKVLSLEKSFKSVQERIPAHKNSYGGIIRVKREDLVCDDADREIVERVINNRHSVREFSGEPINMNDLKSAVSLAHRCPSACNRQGIRLHVLDKKQQNLLDGWLEGTGGFNNEIDKFLMVTGVRSAYHDNEVDQYIVSASIFAGYLSLTLHLYGMGACIIQRPVHWTEEWERIVKKCSIPEDEQIVCMIGVGNLKEEFNVPVSNRINIDEIMHIM